MDLIYVMKLIYQPHDLNQERSYALNPVRLLKVEVAVGFTKEVVHFSV